MLPTGRSLPAPLWRGSNPGMKEVLNRNQSHPPLHGNQASHQVGWGPAGPTTEGCALTACYLRRTGRAEGPQGSLLLPGSAHAWPRCSSPRQTQRGFLRARSHGWGSLAPCTSKAAELGPQNIHLCFLRDLGTCRLRLRSQTYNHGQGLCYLPQSNPMLQKMGNLKITLF